MITVGFILCIIAIFWDFPQSKFASIMGLCLLYWLLSVWKKKMFLYKNLNTGDFVIYGETQDLDLNIFMFVREIKEVRLFSVPCYLVSEDNENNDILCVG